MIQETPQTYSIEPIDIDIETKPKTKPYTKNDYSL